MYKFLGILLAAAVVPAMADTFTYVNWTSSTSSTVSGTVGSVTVSYSGELSFAQTGSTSSPWGGYTPASTWESSLVSNAPSTDQIVAITGAVGITDTVTFSSPVSNLVMDIVSLGQPGVGTQYFFNTPFTILNIGPSNEYGGSATSLVKSGNTLTGTEGDGILLFTGPVTSISWTADNPEYWNGFTFGVDTAASTGTPEPSAWIAVATGLLLIGVRGFRRRHA